VDERFDHYQNALTDIVEKASRQAVEYARQFENPVIVLEDLSYIREHLDYGKWMNRRLHNWAFARLTGRIEDKALDAGIPVRFVNPAYTSQTCHACGHLGSRSSQAAFPMYEHGVLGDGVPSRHQRGGQHRWPPQPVGREVRTETAHQ